MVTHLQLRIDAAVLRHMNPPDVSERVRHKLQATLTVNNYRLALERTQATPSDLDL